MEFLEKALELLTSAEGMTATIAVVLEVVLRLFKSEKPRSILIFVGGAAIKVGAILVKLGDLLDKVVPQRIAAPKE